MSSARFAFSAWRFRLREKALERAQVRVLYLGWLLLAFILVFAGEMLRPGLFAITEQSVNKYNATIQTSLLVLHCGD